MELFVKPCGAMAKGADWVTGQHHDSVAIVDVVAANFFSDSATAMTFSLQTVFHLFFILFPLRSVPTPYFSVGH